MNSRKVSELIKQLFEASLQLETEIPGRSFLPSGQQLGNLGEVLVAEAFGLNLCKAMTKGIDAHTEDGRMVQIKTCLLYTSPSPRDRQKSRMPSSA